jgi:predicted GIY-YIG superfamily endonuclease
MLYKVYILYALDHDKLFTGVTSSLTDRMESHNSEQPEDWTTVYRPWTLVHMELFNDESEASQRESFFESDAGDSYIREYILPLFEF